MKSSICVIFAGGPERGIPCLPVPENAYIICADSGLKLAERLGFAPDLVLGDYDSLGAVPEAYPHIVIPVEKDDTDTLYAVRYALEKGYRDIRIFGAFGGRLDHTLANLQTLEFLHEHGAKGMLVGMHDWAVLLDSETRSFPQMPGFTLSLFAWEGKCTGVTLHGVHYPLENGTLTRQFPLGCSNEITAERAEITVKHGLLLAMGSRLIRAENLQEYFAVDRGTVFPPKPDSSVRGESDYRLNKARTQAALPPVPPDTIIKYVNTFLGGMGMREVPAAEALCRVRNPKYPGRAVGYVKRSRQYKLADKGDLVWVKFTERGHVGVVASGNDVNFDMPENAEEYTQKIGRRRLRASSGVLLHRLGETWDTSFVLVFPLAPIPADRTRRDLERAIGNYLIAKGVPILDYYSHNY